MKRPERAEVTPVGDEAPSSPEDGLVVSTHWIGPLPPPAQLEAFERIVPGGAERIFAQFEAEANHRRAMEKQNVKFIIRDAHIGQALAGLYALGAFGVTAFAIGKGAYWVAGVLGGGTIVSGVIAFLRGSQARKNDDENTHTP